MSDVAAASSAAPTYFAPKIFNSNTGLRHVDIDGGIFANNPEAVAAMEAFRLYPSLERCNISLLSLGTGCVRLTQMADQLSDAGVLRWVMKANLIDMMMSADTNWYDDEISAIYPGSLRLQVPLSADLGHLDNASPENLQGLLAVADRFLETKADVLNQFCLTL
jgi:hypothetical protein